MFALRFAEIVAQFSLASYPVSEGAGVMICIDIEAGTVLAPGGLLVSVTNIDGGSAIGKSNCLPQRIYSFRLCSVFLFKINQGSENK